MSVSQSNSTVTYIGTGSQTSFNVPFIGVSGSDIQVSYTDASGNVTILPSSAYTLTLNPAPPGGLWGVGGSVFYAPSGSPIAVGTKLTITRIVPYTQLTSISNQGAFNAQVVEQALDTLCFEIQQIAARTGQFRGVWTTGITYGYGDIIQDGANGLNSLSYYMCIAQNTSTTWSADLSSGYWTLFIQSVIPTATLPLSIANGGTGSSTAAAALTALGAVSLSGSNTYTGSNNFTGGSASVPTATTGDATAKAASTAFVTNTFAAPPAIGSTTPAAGTFTSLTVGGVAQRIRLSANTTFYVSTTGNDSNNGLTSGTAWATKQHAYKPS